MPAVARARPAQPQSVLRKPAPRRPAPWKPARQRSVPRRPARWRPPRPPLTGLVLWGVLAVACCLWELWSLLEQPNLATSSYAHPTISTLTDPALSTWAGRAVVLAAWLGLGWFLVER